MPLAVATLPDAPTAAPAAPVADAGKRAPHPRVSDPADWRGKLQATRESGARTAAATARAAVAVAPVEDAAETAAHWRAELCDWAEKLLAAPRRALELPVVPAESTLATVNERLALDDAAARTLALLYGARLVGQRGVAAATVARALDADEAAWDEALGRGLCGRLGLAHARDGRLLLSTAAGRFLDGVAPRVPIVNGSASDAELPGGNVRLDGGVDRHAEIGARLAARYGYDVALVLVEGERPARMLAWKLVEARLHGAWPVIDVIVKAAKWTGGLDDGPSVVVLRGDEVPAEIAALPLL
jgi:hypothetical protein